MLLKRRSMWNRYRRSKLYLFLGLGFFLFGLLFLANNNLNNNISDAIPVTTTENLAKPSPAMQEFGKLLKLLEIQEEEMQQIIGEACPAIFKPSLNIKSTKANFLSLLSTCITLITDINSNDPKDYFQSQMAAFALINAEGAKTVSQIAHSFEDGGEEDFYLNTPEELDDWHFEINKQPIELSKDPVILLYNTHNAETYLPTDGKSKLEGKNAGVAKVAAKLQETLEEQYGLKTIRSETIHDYPDWARSYIKSLQTAQKLLKANKSIQAVFDIHRDAGFKSKSTTTAKINGKNAAKIMIVIGTEHERWRENLAFAEQLESKANELYPGLLRDIMIRNNRRYNQQVHPHASILEVGSDLNTLEEAQYSIVLLAKVIAEVIKETN